MIAKTWNTMARLGLAVCFPSHWPKGVCSEPPFDIVGVSGMLLPVSDNDIAT
jgi:hypothetical protein